MASTSEESERQRRRRRERKKRKEEKRKKRHHSSDSSSDGEERSKKRKEEKRKKRHHSSGHHGSDSSSDGEERSKKRKEEKRKKRHHSGDSSSDSEERSKKRRLLKEAKRILKSHQKHRNGASEDVVRNEKFPKVLTEEDYYEKNKEFSAWLKQESGLYFSNLSADDARRLFLDFIQAWNSGKLSQQLYSGIQSIARTDHKWKFKGENDFSVDREEELEFMKKLEKSQRKKFQNEHKELMDELLPKATGRERLVEKKFLRKEEARLREESPELLKEQDIMGGGDDFRIRLERDRARREKRASERNEALNEKKLSMDQKEAAAMDQFKALLNVAGGKITIPKRVN